MRPLRPFALPLSVGTDICRISRVYGILEGPRRERFVRRILAPEEMVRERARLEDSDDHGSGRGGVDGASGGGGGREEGEGARGRRDSRSWKIAVFMAGRFAAKEAAIKALAPRRRVTWHDVMIERLSPADGKERLGSGPPVARIRAEEGRGEEGDDESMLVSISHDGDYATAVCIAHFPREEGGA